MITKAQRTALLFIQAELDRTGGIAPTIRQIAAHMRLNSTSAVVRLLKGLEERRFIRRLVARKQAIEVLNPISRFVALKFNDDTKEVEPMTARK